MPDQRQRAGDNSVNVQIVNHGVSVQEARAIALDVYRANSLDLAGVAKETARERAEEIVDEFLARLQKEPAEAFEALRQPDVQYALYTAEVSYARRGDEDLSKTLVDLLVDRCSAGEAGSLRAIVLNEAIATTTKLTGPQLAIVTVVWLITRAQCLDAFHREALGRWLNHNVVPFVDDLPAAGPSYEHLVYTGCASITPDTRSIGSIMTHVYPGLFPAGFDAHAVSDALEPYLENREVFSELPDREDAYCVAAVYEHEARTIAHVHRLPQDELVRLLRRTWPEQEIAEWFGDQGPKLARLLEVWHSSPLPRMTLTSVGVAIAHANWRRTTGGSTPLATWIPDGS